MKTKIMSLCVAVILSLLSLSIPAFAAEPAGGGVAKDDNSVFSESGTWYGDVATPDELLDQTGNRVTVDDATNWFDRKGGEVINLFQHALKPFCVIGFFLCLALIVIGAIGNKKVMVGGVIGVLICGVCFTMVTCGTQIVQAFSSWLMS